MIRNNLFIFRIFAPQDGFVLFFHSGLKIINLVRTGYATTVALQQKIYDKIVYKTSIFSRLKVIFASHKKVYFIFIGRMLGDHYYKK
jgi:hypothetical protein